MTYPPELKAHALALSHLGYSSPRISKEIEAAHGESIPDATIRMWRANEVAASNAEQDAHSMANWREIIKRSQAIAIDILDTSTFDKSDLPKIIIAAGVGTDKVHAERQLQRGPDVHQHLTLLIKQAEIELRAGREPLLIEETE